MYNIEKISILIIIIIFFIILYNKSVNENFNPPITDQKKSFSFKKTYGGNALRLSQNARKNHSLHNAKLRVSVGGENADIVSVKKDILSTTKRGLLGSKPIKYT